MSVCDYISDQCWHPSLCNYSMWCTMLLYWLRTCLYHLICNIDLHSLKNKRLQQTSVGVKLVLIRFTLSWKYQGVNGKHPLISLTSSSSRWLQFLLKTMMTLVNPVILVYGHSDKLSPMQLKSSSVKDLNRWWTLKTPLAYADWFACVFRLVINKKVLKSDNQVLYVCACIPL